MKASHRICRQALLVGILASFLAICAAAADEAPPSPSAGGSTQIKELIQAWKDPSFSVRRSASQKLDSMGVEAFAPLAEAALERDSETTHRVLEILKRGLIQSDAATKSAAKEAVDRIAASGNNPASRAATEVRREFEASAARPSNTAAVGRAGAGGAWPAQRLGQAMPRMQLIPNFPGMPGIRIGPDGRPIPAIGGLGFPGGQIPGNALPRGGVGPEQIRLLQRLLADTDKMRERDFQELAQTADPARAERLRRSIERNSQRRAQIIDLIMRSR
jgi:hypothetical protein